MLRIAAFGWIAATWLGLAAWYILRSGRIPRPRGSGSASARSQAVALGRGRLKPRSKVPSIALWRINPAGAWLAVLVSTGIVLSVVCFPGFERSYGGSHGSRAYALGMWRIERADILMRFWIKAALVHAALLAALAFGRECPRQLAEFIRTRPISIRHWVGVRGVAGVLMLLVPYIGALVFDLIRPNSAAFRGEVWLGPSGRPWSAVAAELATLGFRAQHFHIWFTLPLLAAACFALCALFTAWLRRGIYGSILGFLATLLIYTLPDMGDRWSWLPRWNPLDGGNVGDVGAFVVLSLTLIAVSSWLALRSWTHRCI